MESIGLGRLLLELEPCHYGYSRHRFRGPAADTEQPYLAFIGTTETVGPFLTRPYPQITSEALSIGCANLGIKNAGPEVFLKDPELLRVAQKADAVVMEVMGATNQSNMFFKVHPRRNDRVTRTHQALHDLLPKLDTTEIHFTGHLLAEIERLSDRVLGEVTAILQEQWVIRMKRLIEVIERPVHLVMLVTDGATNARLIDPHMLEALEPHAASVTCFMPSDEAISEGTEEMIFQPQEHTAAREMLSASAHYEAAELLVEVLGAEMQTARAG
ncbi:MAG: DUF6473 family protein [Pseudomonadota bacterium]